MCTMDVYHGATSSPDQIQRRVSNSSKERPQLTLNHVGCVANVPLFEQGLLLVRSDDVDHAERHEAVAEPRRT